ncbi:MAG: CotH kinase family protein [bacterium]|nr:CotH kinase family protein [bacterium]
MTGRGILVASLVMCGVAWAVINPYTDQNFVRSQRVFDTASVARIEITMDPHEALLLLEPDRVKREFGPPPKEVVESIRQPWWYYTDVLYRCSMVFSNRLFMTRLDNIGIGLRGNNSRRLPKKSYKLDFDHFDQRLHLETLRKVKLLAEAKDRSLIRSALASYVGQEIKIPMYRAGFTLLYINGKCVGIYLLAEQENGDFLSSRFGTSGGTLYNMRKVTRWPRWPPRGGMGILEEASLLLREGNDYDRYGRGLVYELDRDKARAGYGPLSNFIGFLNLAPTDQFVAEIEQRFNVEGFLRYQALEILLGNGDGYWFAGNNYFLFDDPLTRRMEFFARDMSNTLGIDELGKRTIRPAKDFWDPQDIKRWLRMSTVAMDWSSRDVRAWGPRGIKWGGVHRWYWGPLVQEKPLVDRLLGVRRYRRMLHQYLADIAAGPFAPSNMEARARYYQRLLAPAVEEYERNCWKRDELGYDLTRRKFDAAFEEPDRYRPLQIIDPIWGGFVCMGVIPFVSNRVATLKEQLDEMIVGLNEVVVRNTTGVTNDIGERSAWVELYNASFREVSCAGLGLQRNDGAVWALPAVRIGARGYLLVWLDGKPGAGPLHAPFEVAVRDTLRLWWQGEELDRITLPATLAPNQSYGRKMEWTGYERRFVTPTPGRAN